MKMNLKIIAKAAVIGGLLILMLIPLAFVKGTLRDRLRYKSEAEGKITQSWGRGVVIAAPVLNVPYQKAITTKKDGKESTSYETRYYKYTPALADTVATILPQVRYIGIFKVPVYTAKIKINGYFAAPGRADMISQKAFISMELGSLKGIAATPTLAWAGKKVDFENALEGAPLRSPTDGDFKTYDNYSGGALRMLSAPAPSKNERMDFDIDLEIRGSGGVSFVPLAKESKYKISSSWANPSFIGGFLPDTRTVTADGFEAQWNVNSLSSGVPAYVDEFKGVLPEVSVSLLFPVDNYKSSERAVKYGALFIALTFLACFVFELAGGKPVHPFQYILVGVAMAVFYLLLVALSEFIGFGWAYLAAAGATVALISAYARWGVLKTGGKKVWLAALGLAFIYGYLYILLQLEDLSLIFGTLGLFAGVAAMMYATRNINWYE